MKDAQSIRPSLLRDRMIRVGCVALLAIFSAATRAQTPTQIQAMANSGQFNTNSTYWTEARYFSLTSNQSSYTLYCKVY